MKKLKLVLLAALVMAVPLFAFVGTAQAGNFRNGDNAVVKEGEVVDHTLFITGNNVEVKGEVKGDVFCAGQNISVDAKVAGDVICAGMNVRVGGTVDGDVRLAGQNVTLSGSVAQNASLFGGNVVTDESSNVGRDLLTAGSTITLNGQAARDVDVAGERVTVNSMVGRNITASTENLTLSEAANITGNVLYYSKNDLQRASGAQVTGEVKKEAPRDHGQEQNTLQGVIAGSAMFFLMLLVLALALAALFPRMLHAVSDNAIEKPGTTVLIGLAAFVLMPVLIIGSFLTVIGMLLGVVLLLIWTATLILSCVIFSFYLGRLVLQRVNGNPLLMMFVGVLIFAVLMLIPFVGMLTMIAAALFGGGMVIRELFKRTPKPAYEAAPVATSRAKKK